MELLYKMLNIKCGRVLAAVTGILLTASSAVAEITVTGGPIIEPNKSEIILQNGENFTLVCKSNNIIEFKQQEQAEDMTLPFQINERTSRDDEYDYIIELDLLNVNEHAVGYFACFDDTINGDEVLKLNSLKAEPNNDEHITYIYVYVNGSENLFAPMNQVLTAKDDSIVVIGCRPTSPDIIVDLTPDDVIIENYDPKIGFTVPSDSLNSAILNLVVCGFNLTYPKPTHKYKDVFIHKYIGHNGTPIIVENRLRYFLEGEAFTISCYVKYEKNVAIHLDWVYPQMNEDSLSRVIFETNEKDQFFEKIYKNITIINATEKDSGIYACKVNNNPNRKAEAFMQYIEKPFVNFTTTNKRLIEESNLKDTIKLLFTLISHPPANITLYKDNVRVEFNGKYQWENKQTMNFYFLRINSLSLADTANYTVVANNGQFSESITFDIRIKSLPNVSMDLTEQTYVVHSNENNWIICEVSGYPLPNVYWYLTSYAYGSEKIEIIESIQEINSLIRLKSYLDLNNLKYSGNVTCAAKNDVGSNNSSKSIILYEIDDGFGIKNKTNNWFVEGEDVTLTCVGSFHIYYHVTWINFDNSSTRVESYDNDISNVATLNFNDISMNQAGMYECKGYGKKEEKSDFIEITVHGTSPAVFYEPSAEMEENVYPHQNVTLVCKASGIPRPLISWLKDGYVVVPDDTNGTIIISQKDINKTDIESKLGIVNIQEEFGGMYECITDKAIRSKTFNINVNTTNSNGLAYLSIIAVIIVLLIFVIIYLIWRVRKEKMFRKELAKAGLLYFKEGVTKSINPDLGIDEQAELLPYDDRFEFPSSKLLLGKQLGSGAFGVVYKAEARGIINAEEDTIVAVKMVKKTADNLAIKSLASELKIMVHMGKHINIVNLLGACTKNVDKRELIVIVEYCKFGNILNYMIKHREVFIDQLTENTEQNFGKINRGFSCSSGNSGTHSTYFGSNHTQDTDHTFLNTAGSNRSGLRKVSESGYVQPMWSSNYESDYSYDGRTMRPLSSRDLLCWAFQIARGMEYLASRKVLHGDLAARNILLAEDNVVKICDFGLARSVYKNDEYQKKENSPLPVKWLAIECMTDRIFSTQSDVWSFGIVLWELFTLAKTPYPGISPSDLLPWLLAGKRLDKPRYADDRIYEVMKQCWDKKPTARPSFTALQEILGSFLEDNVRTHYVDLNNTYLNLNQETAGQEDYLAMMRAPDYNNHVTPSPHDYVNEFNNFFPKTPTLLHDEEGYLQMNTINKGGYQPNIQESTFDFDSRKSTRSQEATAHGSELTPMLTLNNLPTRSGSESDHEGNASPYLQTCPPIEEETDEVFEVKQNNIKNSNQNRAVTNPTYIAFDTDLDKKPQSHSYANIGNGLVI